MNIPERLVRRIGGWLNQPVQSSRIWMLFLLWIIVNNLLTLWGVGPEWTGLLLLTLVVAALIAWADRRDS